MFIIDGNPVFNVRGAASYIIGNKDQSGVSVGYAVRKLGDVPMNMKMAR